MVETLNLISLCKSLPSNLQLYVMSEGSPDHMTAMCHVSMPCEVLQVLSPTKGKSKRRKRSGMLRRKNSLQKAMVQLGQKQLGGG